MKAALLSLFAITSATIAVSAASAAPIPYANPGHPAPTVSMTASATGSVTGYFVGYNAADTDEIRMLDLTSGTTSSYFFTNNNTAAGTSANFGSVKQGDVLVFELYNETTKQLFASLPSDSVDGINHAYVTGFTGGTLNGVNYVNGNYTYVGMEDLPLGASDLDYNDDQFLFTDVAASVTPEPGSLLLLGTGLAGFVGTQRRRLGF